MSAIEKTFTETEKTGLHEYGFMIGEGSLVASSVYKSYDDKPVWNPLKGIKEIARSTLKQPISSVHSHPGGLSMDANGKILVGAPQPSGTDSDFSEETSNADIILGYGGAANVSEADFNKAKDANGKKVRSSRTRSNNRVVTFYFKNDHTQISHMKFKKTI